MDFGMNILSTGEVVCGMNIHPVTCFTKSVWGEFKYLKIIYICMFTYIYKVYLYVKYI